MNRNDTQATVFDFLADPATHRGAAVKRIDTHAASVFLAGERALKVKRAVRFPFLDYSTLEKREAACRAELEVNRPYAPQIYLRVLPITRGHDGKLALDDDGETIEWAIEMRRFDETQTLDHLADAGKLDVSLADDLARAVANAHAKAPVVEPAPWIASLSTIIAQNEHELSETPTLFASSDVAALTQTSREALARVTPLLKARGRLDLIRRCHGDLHLGNVVLTDGRPVLFDAIEFDPLIATGDVFYDLAFLLMDLLERGLPEQASRVLNGYLAQTRRLEDLDALAALPLFLSLRAAIRAKVTAARLPHADHDKRDEITRVARGYFTLARQLIAPPTPQLVAIGGLSGTGKSVLARSLAADVPPAPGAVVLRSDVERKALFGKADTEKLPEQAYAADVTARVYAALADKARRVLAAGHSAVADAVYAKPAERDAIAAVAKAAKVPLHGLFLTADLGTRIGRVGTRVADVSDADAAVAQRQETYQLGTLDWNTVDASGTPEATLQKARAVIA